MENKESLIEVLNQKIEQIKQFPKSLQKQVESVMANTFNVRYGDTVDIFNGLSPFSVNELNEDMLYKLSYSIKVVANEHFDKISTAGIDIEKCFSEEEIEQYSKKLEIETDFDIEISDWKRVDDKRVHIYVSVDEVVKWRDYNKLKFNPNTQRDLITIVTKGVPIKKLDINRKSINEMNELRKKGLYFPVKGIININPEFFDLPKEKDGKYVIPKESHMDLIEGFHNHVSMCEVKEDNPDYEEICEFDIMFLNEDEANIFISQMDKKNHFKSSQIIRMDRVNQVNYIINQLNISGDFHLYGTIKSDMSVFINRVITRLFDIGQDRQKAVELLDILINNLNYVVKSKKHFDKPFNKYEWLIYITATKYSIDKKRDFRELVDNIDINKIIKTIDVVNVPNGKHYRAINKFLSEVK